MAGLRLAGYLYEMWKLRISDKSTRHLFFNYTIDEPVWLALAMTCGAVCIVASRGTHLTRVLSLALTSLCIMPAIFYLWGDYRWYTSVIFLHEQESGNATTPIIPTVPLHFSFICGLSHIGLLIGSMLFLFEQISGRLRSTQPASFTRVFLICGLVFAGLCLAIFGLDLYALGEKIFYKVFHGSEQKTPFLLMLASIFALLSSNPQHATLALPACLVVLLYTAKSTLFLLLSYSYLVFKGYFREQLCDLFVTNTDDCFATVTTGGVFLHMFEAFIHLAAAVASIFLAAIVMRVAHLRREVSNTDVHYRTAKSQALIRWIGVVHASAALVVIGSSILSFVFSSTAMHPLIVIYLQLYHIAVAFSLIVFPLYQICVSEVIHEVPVARHALLILSAIQFFNIVTQLDYRGTGEDLNVIWKLHHFVEVLTAFGYFFTAILVLRIENVIRPDPLRENYDVLDFDNPLAAEMQDSELNEGYIQLRQEETI
ncbi:unnamed protein product, partial [Mesorhabditis spiculigera]